ncbi:hypothetical protein A9Q83_06325 [Alphaproteobacteria bacterium 46_93_T64]|nr:hypothetical protein A9Q83_06325 [Alphaproteobacteria bacterium 46_93_T64]
MVRQMDIYKLPALDLSDAADVEAAAKLIFQESLAHLRINFDHFVKSKDEAALMQLRIGMRRTRVALRLFREIIPIETRKKFSREFRHFGKMFGNARDMDVFLRGMLKEDHVHLEMQTEYERLRVLAQSLRTSEYERIHAEITAERFEDLLSAFTSWHQQNWSLDLDTSGEALLQGNLGSFAVGSIATAKKEFLEKGAVIENCSTEELHKIRKYVKRARYYLRFFSSLLDRSKIDEGYGLLAQMQDDLGHVNDVKDGLRLTSKLCAEVPAIHISRSLKLCAVLIENAGHEVEAHLLSYQEHYKPYESFVITELDLL